MDVRKYRAKTFQEAFRSIRQDLGENALILSSKIINAKSLGQENIVEIKAVKEICSRVSGLPISPLPTVATKKRNSLYDDFQSLLELNGLEKKLAQNYIDKYKLETNQNEVIDLALFANIISAQLKLGLGDYPSEKFTAFVGPTGVGKTTTIAKLAGKACLDLNQSVALITIDTHRVGGAEQLCALASIFQLPSVIVTNLEQFVIALNNFSNYDRVFIDTAGSSPTDQEKICEIKEYLAKQQRLMTTLLLPATGNVYDYRRILKSYGLIGLNSIGVTKTDETCYFGPCFTALVEANLPVEVFGTGQGVPDDIEIASASKLIELLIRASH